MKKILAFTLMIMLLAGNVWAQPPTPATPQAPELQGIQIPKASFNSQALPLAKSGHALTPTSEALAWAAAPSYATAAGSSTYASTYMVVPPGVSTPNKFYIPYAPSTVAECSFGQWLPMWMDVRGWGPLYSYEWYPDGKLEIKNLAYVQYPGWLKMWFNGNTAGWHTIQYYCNGWSNYIYVYVYRPPCYSPCDLGPCPTTPCPPEHGCNA